MGILIGAMLIIAAWLCVLAGLMLWGVSLGISWQAALGVVAFANLASGSLLLWVCARASREHAFPVHLV
jgi:hypothetical protein